MLEHDDHVAAHVVEMQEWFRAFATQNTSHMDYSAYFKPVLCYLERVDHADEELEDAFDSERHQLDAVTCPRRATTSTFRGARAWS